MTGEQILRQTRHILRAATWTDSPNGYLFASPNVFISSGFDAARLGEVNFPFAVVGPGEFTPLGEGENPLLGMSEFQVHVFVRHSGDRLGEYVLIGGQRVETTGQKTSRGILELEEEVKRAISTLGPLSGMKVEFTATGDVVPEVVQGSDHILRKEFRFHAMTSSHRTYPTIYNPAGSGTPTVTLTWTDPPARFDRYGVHIRRIAGSSAPTLSTGTLVANILAGVQTTTDAPGAGTWTYGIWGTFDETGSGSVERYSDRAISVTVVV